MAKIPDTTDFKTRANTKVTTTVIIDTLVATVEAKTTKVGAVMEWETSFMLI